MGEPAKKLGWKEKWMDSRLLATIDPYQWGGKNCRHDLEPGLMVAIFKEKILNYPAVLQKS
jgi:hypothetical protein